MSKLLATLVFIVTVVSFERHALGRLVPFVFYPVLLTAFSETPYTMLLKRFMVAVPFCLMIGLSNLFFETGTAFTVGSVAFSNGVVSLAVILYRAWLCVTAVLLLMVVTPFPELTARLRTLRVPAVFVSMFEMTYRYLGVLPAEAASQRLAYAMRHPNGKGVDLRHAGSFVGSLLLRAFDRAERIYAAMKCRGYTPSSRRKRDLRICDILYCTGICALCVWFRFVDVGAWLMGRLG